MKLKSRLLTSAAGIALALGIAATGSVATAQPAEALQLQKCKTWAYPSNPMGYWLTRCYFNYNWWEETFQGKRDGYRYQWCFRNWTYCQPWERTM